LLTLRKTELAAALKIIGAAWREDATNKEGDFFRNRVRSTVIPPWIKAAGRDALAGAALSRSLIEEDDAALDAWVDELAPFGRVGRSCSNSSAAGRVGPSNSPSLAE
jgi:tRNA(Ile)-lysidine synthase